MFEKEVQQYLHQAKLKPHIKSKVEAEFQYDMEAYYSELLTCGLNTEEAYKKTIQSYLDSQDVCCELEKTYQPRWQQVFLNTQKLINNHTTELISILVLIVISIYGQIYSGWSHDYSTLK